MKNDIFFNMERNLRGANKRLSKKAGAPVMSTGSANKKFNVAFSKLATLSESLGDSGSSEASDMLLKALESFIEEAAKDMYENGCNCESKDEDDHDCNSMKVAHVKTAQDFNAGGLEQRRAWDCCGCDCEMFHTVDGDTGYFVCFVDAPDGTENTQAERYLDGVEYTDTFSGNRNGNWSFGLSFDENEFTEDQAVNEFDSFVNGLCSTLTDDSDEGFADDSVMSFDAPGCFNRVLKCIRDSGMSAIDGCVSDFCCDLPQDDVDDLEDSFRDFLLELPGLKREDSDLLHRDIWPRLEKSLRKHCK